MKALDRSLLPQKIQEVNIWLTNIIRLMGGNGLEIVFGTADKIVIGQFVSWIRKIILNTR